MLDSNIYVCLLSVCNNFFFFFVTSAVWHLTNGTWPFSDQFQQRHPHPLLHLSFTFRLPLWFHRPEVNSCIWANRLQMSVWNVAREMKLTFILRKYFLLIYLHHVVSVMVTCTLFLRTPENSSRASSPSCSDYENFPMVPTLETSYLARAGKNEFLNLVPDIEEMRPGWGLTYLVSSWFLVSGLLSSFSPLCAVITFFKKSIWGTSHKHCCLVQAEIMWIYLNCWTCRFHLEVNLSFNCRE